MKKYVYIFLSFCLFIFSCKKEEIVLPVQEISLATTETINEIDFPTENIGYAVGGTLWESGIILKTIDKGLTWSIDESIESQGFFGVDFVNENVGFATGFGGKIMRTTDGGVFWDVYQDNSYGPYKDVSAINENNIVVVGGEGDTGLVMTSQDEWWIFDLITQENSFDETFFISEEIGFAIGNGFVRKTEDSGLTWQQASPKNDRFTGIDFTDSQVGYVCGFQGSIWKTEDSGGSWIELEKNNKLFTKRIHFNAIDFYNENLGMVAGVDGQVFLTRNGGHDWEKVKMNTSSYLKAVAFADKNTAIVAGLDGEMWRISL